jgi:hypothetical protein
MSEVERVAHSIRHGNKYHLKESKAGLLDEAAALNEDFGARREHGYIQGLEDDPPPPPGVTQNTWNLVLANQLGNAATITHNDQVRDSLVSAGYEDYVKRAHEKAMRERAGAYGAAGADDAWGNAQFDWYTNKYGNFFDGGVNNQSSGLTFGGSSVVPTNPGAPTGKPSGAPVNVGGGGGASSNPDFGQAVEMTNRAGNTPFIDAYMRSRESAKKEGPVTGMMKKYMEE